MMNLSMASQKASETIQYKLALVRAMKKKFLS
jgi:hypothetical protein